MNKNDFDFDSFKTAGENFMTTLTAKLVDAGIPAESMKSDHLCFRVRTDQEYTFYRAALADHGQLLTEANVNGRAIATFRLTSAFQTDCHEVPLLELPAPKQGTSYLTGFEHAEFLINESFSSFRSRYPQLNFEERGNQTLNPELCLKFDQGMQVKFHHLALDRVIEFESAEIEDIIFDFDGATYGHESISRTCLATFFC